jgi:hypothetical protein
MRPEQLDVGNGAGRVVGMLGQIDLVTVRRVIMVYVTIVVITVMVTLVTIVVISGQIRRSVTVTATHNTTDQVGHGLCGVIWRWRSGYGGGVGTGRRHRIAGCRGSTGCAHDLLH